MSPLLPARLVSTRYTAPSGPLNMPVVSCAGVTKIHLVWLPNDSTALSRVLAPVALVATVATEMGSNMHVLQGCTASARLCRPMYRTLDWEPGDLDRDWMVVRAATVCMLSTYQLGSVHGGGS